MAYTDALTERLAPSIPGHDQRAQLRAEVLAPAIGAEIPLVMGGTRGEAVSVLAKSII